MVDLMPTILEVLDLSIPEGVQGESLMAEINGQVLPDRPVFAEASHVGNGAALIVGEEKIVREKYLSSDLLSFDRLVYNLRQLFSRQPDRIFALLDDPSESRPLEGTNSDLGPMLEDIRAANRRGGGAEGGDGTALDPETVEQLRALGYLD